MLLHKKCQFYLLTKIDKCSNYIIYETKRKKWGIHMKVQDLAIIFIIIILPISLVISIYTQYQIQTVNTQTLYDGKLTSATYDAIRAFQINTTSSAT